MSQQSDSDTAFHHHELNRRGGWRGARWLEGLWENTQSYTESSYWCCEESFFWRKTWASRCVRRKEGGKTQAATLSEISAWLGSTGGTLGGANDCYRGRLILMCRCSRRCPPSRPPNAASCSYLLVLKRKLNNKTAGTKVLFPSYLERVCCARHLQRWGPHFLIR